MSIKRWVKKIVTQYRYAETTVANPKHNDLYIVEFPKSGITWLTTLLANLALKASGREEVATYYSIAQFVPDVHQTRDVGGCAFERPPVRMIKSHSEFNPNYVSVIYLVRNPLAVMKSWYRFNIDHGVDVPLFGEFIRSSKYGVNRWKRHVDSWLVGKVSAQRLHLIKYEDLIVDPLLELRALSDNLGWQISEKCLRESISLSSIESMKCGEELYREKDPKYVLNFVKGGDIEVDLRDIEYISSSCEEQLKLLGYDRCLVSAGNGKVNLLK